MPVLLDALQLSRSSFHSTPAGRLAPLAPSSQASPVSPGRRQRLRGWLVGIINTRSDEWGDTGQIGALQRRTHVAGCLTNAAAAAGDVCRRTFGVAPEVEIVGDVAASLLYMPDHLFGVTFELLKNSMRAVCERHGDAGHALPPVCVRVCDGAQDITISVTDQGVGFSVASLPDLFRFNHSTSASRVNVGDDAVSMYHSGSRSNAMAGHGYGLPLARINVRSFGGDIILAPMQGCGCAAFMYLQKHSDSTF